MFPLYNTVRSRRFPFVNWMLILLNGLIFTYEITLNSEGLHRFILNWGLVPFQLASDYAASWVTLFSSMFIHGSWIHILGNMWTLMIFGDNVEDRMGHGRFLFFYLLCGIGAASMQVLLSSSSHIPLIGASGAIAGVLGAFLVLYPHARIVSLAPILFIFTLAEIPAIIYLGLWFILQLFSGWQSLQGAVTDGIAWWAHIGGFLFGIITARTFTKKRVYKER